MTPRPLRIAIGVHGRFYAFDLARALLALGHDVTVFTNYPARVAARFGLPRNRVRSFVAHGVAARVFAALSARTGWPVPESRLHQAFGRWLAKLVPRQPWDAVLVFSGVAEETFDVLRGTGTPVFVTRASAHIRVQDRLLAEEAERTGTRSERPSAWMIAREEREYVAATAVCVLSTFAERTFLEAGHPPSRLCWYGLGVDASSFAASPEAVAERHARICSGAPLRVLYVGPKLARKGMFDLEVVARRLGDRKFCFRAVGPEPPELVPLGEAVESVGKVPQDRLSAEYGWADVFLFPTVEDGFAVVVAQALMSGLPVLTTENCGAADLLVEGETGWVVPARSPDRLVERLRALDADREGLARVARHIHETARPPSWEDAARAFLDAAAPFLRDAPPAQTALSDPRPARP